jgi:hypothetical protein
MRLGNPVADVWADTLAAVTRPPGGVEAANAHEGMVGSKRGERQEIRCAGHACVTG